MYDNEKTYVGMTDFKGDYDIVTSYIKIKVSDKDG